MKNALAISLAVAMLIRVSLHGDSVELVNGDRYTGKVLLLDEASLVLQSEIQGRIELPRAKVALVRLGTASPSEPVEEPVVSKKPTEGSQPAGQVLGELRRSGVDSGLMKQLEQQFFSGMSPEVSRQFNETVSGLISGKMDLSDIRKQAREAAGQIRAVQSDLGEDAGGVLDGYLKILEGFLGDTAPVAPPAEKD